jgi:hypothetical protein
MDRADVACWARRAGISPDGPGCCALDARGQDPHADIEAVEDEEAALGIRGLVSEAVERRVL